MNTTKASQFGTYQCNVSDVVAWGVVSTPQLHCGVSHGEMSSTFSEKICDRKTPSPLRGTPPIFATQKQGESSLFIEKMR